MNDSTNGVLKSWKIISKPYVFIPIVISLIVLAMLSSKFRQTDQIDENTDLNAVEESETIEIRPFINQTLIVNRRIEEINDYIRQGDTFSSALSRYGIERSQIHNMSEALKSEMDFRKLKSGMPFKLRYDGVTEELIGVFFRSNHYEWIGIVDKNGKWDLEKQEVDVQQVERQIGCNIKDSLWNASIREKMSPSLILDLADLFSWQIDFATDIRNTDMFKLIYNQDQFPEGDMLDRDIIAAFFRNKNNCFYAFRYAFDDGDVHYFDRHGQSVRRSFLKSPLRYRYISSGYTNRRYHPILKIYRPHHGVDYAAPTGTPVSALGDGTVTYCGWKGGYGNYIQLKHGDAYITCYGHLSGFAKGMRKGKHVSQGDVIGYVGSTGLSTGPHLDFRVKYRGSYINPLKMESPPAEPIPEKYRASFNKLRNSLMEKMDEIRIKESEVS